MKFIAKNPLLVVRLNGKDITFKNGVFQTSDMKLIVALKNNPAHGRFYYSVKEAKDDLSKSKGKKSK